MSFSWQTMMTGLLVVALIVLGWAADHYHSKAESWRDTAHRYQQLAASQGGTIATINERQRSLAALDAKYTQDLADAQNQIAALQRDVAAGRKQLQLNARCPAVPADKPASTTGMDDAAGARLTDAAERDYFILRKRIEFASKQITGLQHYIKEQCSRCY
ncbi:lysis protein [Erwinia sp. PK3-005]